MADITLHPETQSAGEKSIFNGNKGLLVVILVVALIAVVGLSTIFILNKSDKYQGMIKQVEMQTQQLKNSTNKQKNTPIPNTPAPKSSPGPKKLTR